MFKNINVSVRTKVLLHQSMNRRSGNREKILRRDHRLTEIVRQIVREDEELSLGRSSRSDDCRYRQYKDHQSADVRMRHGVWRAGA